MAEKTEEKSLRRGHGTSAAGATSGRAVKRTVAVAVVVAAITVVAARDALAQARISWGGAEVGASGFSWRRIGQTGDAWQHGLDLAWGPTLAVDEGPFRFSGITQIDLRAFATDSWALSLSTHTFEVAARLGPIEPRLRVGFSLLTVDDFAGEWSAELVSPRVGAGVGVRVARRVRITVGGYAEYLWRWFGPSVLERGLTIELRYERPWRALAP